MAFNPNSFVSKFSQSNGFGRATHFEVEFTLPAFLKQKYFNNEPLLTMAASSVNIPGVTIKTTAIRRGGTTYEEYFPLNVSFADLNVNFFSDGKAELLQMFKDWTDGIYGIIGGQDNSFQVSYRNEYVAPIVTIKHYDSEGNMIIIYTFYDVFPETIGNVDLSWGSIDNIVLIPVSFKYRVYTQQRPAQPAPRQQVRGGSYSGVPLQSSQTTGIPVQPVTAKP